MVNAEIRNQTSKTEYRGEVKTFTKSQLTTENKELPGQISNSKNKITTIFNILKLVGGITIFLIVLGSLANIFLNNPFKELQNIPQSPNTQTDTINSYIPDNSSNKLSSPINWLNFIPLIGFLIAIIYFKRIR